MIERLKSTLRDTFVYSLSNMAPKLIGVVLLPVYTAYLTQQDFGKWDLLDITTNILAEIFLLGQAASIIFLNNSSEYKARKKDALFTITLFLVFVCALLIMAGELLINTYNDLEAALLIKPVYIRLIVWIVFFRTLNNLFLSKFRAEEKAFFFTAVSVTKLILIAAGIIYALTVLNKGLEGIFTATLIGEAATALFLLIKLLNQMSYRFDGELLRVSFKFGFPLVFGTIGIMLLNLSDRYIITYLLGPESNAIYGLGYRIAGVLNMFLIMPFSLSLMPVAYKYYGQKDDKRFFSKLMTYSAFMFLWGSVAISLFSREIVGIFAEKPEYFSAYMVVPVILISYSLSGMRITASLGMMLTKNTKHIATITLSAAFLNIALNFIFIPKYGIIAAAFNTLIAFVIFYLATLIVSDKHFKIPFEHKKILLLIFWGIILSVPVYIMPQGAIYLFVKLILTGAFPFILLPFGFYEERELEYIKSPKKLINTLLNTFTGTGNKDI
ncbi:polysaccharide biosynthesis protein [Melioribacter roseus P3M-2]|uniref:Polysaccharide biosynthesis protein n=1 Tax=Melioribacter roseus (strain DSM 23840 / JCM 17771 / VKM B-2668 / P3M-2) TaxID=1191523 RepID=I6ZZG7_MELRP|nr:oligosaccharide flippase family protein [Melioribacter roseus]AFN74388.1 polysaccharide biosynthesis protein [Melioribacter roseus P3M-2]